MSSHAFAIVALLFGTTERAKPKVSLTTEQQVVIAAAVEDTFPRPHHLVAPLVLCLDVQLVDDGLEVIAPPLPRQGAKSKKARALEPPAGAVQGAPPELLARIFRQWRPVVSAATCRLDPRQPFMLDDGRTPARLVTVRMATHIATGALRIEWTGGDKDPPGSLQSRDCTATHGARGWTVRCGGVWSE